MNAPRYLVERTADTYETSSARDAWTMAYRVARCGRRIGEHRTVSMTRIYSGDDGRYAASPITRWITG